MIDPDKPASEMTVREHYIAHAIGVAGQSPFNQHKGPSGVARAAIDLVDELFAQANKNEPPAKPIIPDIDQTANVVEDVDQTPPATVGGSAKRNP